jgi:carboxylesterase
MAQTPGCHFLGSRVGLRDYDGRVTEFRSPGDGDKSPIFASRRGPAVLCLHGLTGTPYEVAPLAHALVAAGFSVSAPLLAGHGDTTAALAATRWQDWFASAEAAFDRLREASGDGPVAVLGFSMGGLLALRLARLRPKSVSALVALSVPLRLRPWQIVAAKAWRRVPAFLRRGPLAVMRKRGGSDVTDEKVRRENPGMPEIPLAGVAELVDLAELVRRDLTFIKQPTLVGHGELDHTIALQASYELAGSLAAEVVQRLWLPRSGHLVGVDVERAQLTAAVVRFLSQHTPREAAASPESRPA